jgi:hypothetical protein
MRDMMGECLLLVYCVEKLGSFTTTSKRYLDCLKLPTLNNH